MKKLILCMFAIVGIMLAGCSEDQTSFSLDKVPYKTIVKGKIVYNEGTTMENGRFAYKYVPAANLDVYIVVNNSDYSDVLGGQTVLTTKTNANGEYSIEVPAAIQATTAQLKTAQFEGIHRTIERQNNKYVVKEQIVAYSAQCNLNLCMSGFQLRNLTCNYTMFADTPQDCALYATLSGTIGRNVEVKGPAVPQRDEYNRLIGYNSATINYAYERAANVDMIIKVNYGEYHGVQNFNATTDSQGQFSLAVPVLEFPANLSYSIELLPIDKATFTHYLPKTVEYETWNGYYRTYTDYEAVQLKGWFEQTSFTCEKSYGASFEFASIVNTIALKGLVFLPYEYGEDTVGYIPNMFDSSAPWKEEL